MGFDKRQKSDFKLFSIRVEKKENGSAYFSVTEKNADGDYQHVTNSQNVNGLLSSISFKKRKDNKNKEISTVDLTLVDREEKQILFVSFFESLLTNELLNKLHGEDFDQKDLNFWLTTAQKFENGAWVNIKTENGTLIPRVNIREKDSDEPFFTPTLWDDENSDNKCEHPNKEIWLQERKLAKKVKSNASMAEFMKDFLVDDLTARGWVKEDDSYKNDRYTSEGFKMKNPHLKNDDNNNYHDAPAFDESTDNTDETTVDLPF